MTYITNEELATLVALVAKEQLSETNLERYRELEALEIKLLRELVNLKGRKVTP